MPEGPSIILVKEAVAKFTGEKIIAISGNSKIDQGILLDQKIIEFKSWGKHFLICLEGLRVHFLMFGSYTVDEKKPEKVIRKQTGLRKRRSFTCLHCQTLYN